LAQVVLVVWARLMEDQPHHKHKATVLCFPQLHQLVVVLAAVVVLAMLQ
jgi:hypothetical protein